VVLEWDANSETDLAGYRLYYGFASRTYIQVLGQGVNVSFGADENPDPTKVQFTLTGLDDTKTYYIAATAYDNEVPSNESDFSNEVSVGPLSVPPTSPSNLRLLSVVGQGE
jgi:hypothetical protein